MSLSEQLANGKFFSEILGEFRQTLGSHSAVG